MPDERSDRRDALAHGCLLRDYTIEEVLGHGGFGIVYKARHNELDHVVAIKEYLPAELAVREGKTIRARSADREAHFADGLRRFRKEAKALIEFQQHPSIVDCREFFRANGTAYLVMEYVEGMPLSELLRQREAAGQPFTESDLLGIAIPLAQGLAHIHRARVIHRDIKPANILVRRADQRPVLIDFGAAKQAVAEHSRSLAPYTEGYAALEQVADGQLGPWTDMYGYGAVLWRMVAGGNRPWEPPNPVKVESRANAGLRESDDPLPTAKELGAGRFADGILETIDGCLQLRDTERIGESDAVVQMLQGRGGESQQPETAEQQAEDVYHADLPGPESAPAPSGHFTSGRSWKIIGVLAAIAVAVAVAIVALVPRDSTVEIPETPVGWSFSIEAEPESATVALLNVPEAYRPGMLLVPGWYKVAVGAPGFTPHREWVRHLGSETLHKVVLKPRPDAEPEPVQPPSEAVATPLDLIVSQTEEVDTSEAVSTEQRPEKVSVGAHEGVDSEPPDDKNPTQPIEAQASPPTEPVSSNTVKTEHELGEVANAGEPVSGEQPASEDQANADPNGASDSICGDGTECFKHGEAYRKGDGVSQDTARAGQYYRLACEDGIAEGCHALGRLYYNGQGVRRDWTRAMELHTQACAEGVGAGCGDLGVMYSKGEGVSRDPVRAADLLRQACDSGVAWGCGWLGTMYSKGEGVRLDRVHAAEFYKRACDGGVAWGCGELGHLHRDGWGIRQNRTRAAELYKQTCDAKVYWGCSWLGYLYYRGWGVRRNRNRAAQLYEQACNRGVAWSCRNLGYLYQKGEGVRRDRSRATDYFHRACEGDDLAGCTWLALNYYRGTGVGQDRSAAASLLQKACNNGHKDACELRKQLKWN